MKEDYVLLFMVRKDDRFLLQHRDNDAPTYPGYWGFFGGAIESGESPYESIQREVHEELCYQPDVQHPSLTTEYQDSVTNRHGTKYYFIERLAEAPDLDLQEGQGMEWLTVEDCKSLLISEYNFGKILELIKIAEQNVR